MNSFTGNKIINSIQDFLSSIDYAVWFTYVPLVLLILCVLSRFVCLTLTVISPGKFGGEHRKTMSVTSRTCYWLSIVAQMLIWIFGTTEQISFIGDVDILVGCVMLLIAFISILVATIGMIFSRKGKRVFIAKSIYSQTTMLMLLAAFISVFGWLFMQ